MTTLARRDDGELAHGIAAWCARQWPGAAHEIVELDRPSSGWSNETLIVTVSSQSGTTVRRDRFVVRLPPPLPSWPSYDLHAQARVLDALAPGPIPVPGVIAVVDDERFLGAPFLVMSHEPGRVGGEVPAFEPWITDAPAAAQRSMHGAFATMLATIHRVDWHAARLDDALRGADGSIANEIAWWKEYVDWAADGEPTPSLANAIAWCERSAPNDPASVSLCWGDARIGNVLYSDDRQIACVLDWEMATLGAAESDLGWYLSLEALTTFFTKRTVAGFLDRVDFVAHYEQALGREIENLEWYEIFALTRSIAINDCQARLAATTGTRYPGIAGEQNPVLPYLAQKIAAFEG